MPLLLLFVGIMVEYAPREVNLVEPIDGTTPELVACDVDEKGEDLSVLHVSKLIRRVDAQFGPLLHTLAGFLLFL